MIHRLVNLVTCILCLWGCFQYTYSFFTWILTGKQTFCYSNPQATRCVNFIRSGAVLNYLSFVFYSLELFPDGLSSKGCAVVYITCSEKQKKKRVLTLSCTFFRLCGTGREFKALHVVLYYLLLNTSSKFHCQLKRLLQDVGNSFVLVPYSENFQYYIFAFL